MIFSGGLVPTFMVVEKLGLINTVWAMLIPNALSIWNLMLCRNYIMNNIPNELYEAGVLKDYNGYDKALAAALLEQAGWTDMNAQGIRITQRYAG